MKYKSLVLFIPLFFNLSSCACGYTYYYKDEPVYMPLNKINSEIKLLDAREIRKPGKIYTYKDYIFINESNFGVHIIDNNDPKNPKNKSFLKIPLNDDIAIKGDIMYADSVSELAAIDISDINNIKVKKKIDVSGYLNKTYTNMNFIDPQKGLQIGFKRTGPFYTTKVCDSLLPKPMSNRAGPSSAPVTGQGGSLARFSIVDNLLYTVNNSELFMFNISEPSNPEKYGSVKIDSSRNDIETIYSYKDKIFMGAATGTYIYDNAVPEDPSFITKIDHTRACDPVVAEGNTAYVTISSGNTCRNGINRLEIIDFTDIKESKIINSYPMNNPAGLAVKNSNLFVCDRGAGLKVFDARDPLDLKEISTVNIKFPRDIILDDDYQGIVISNDGLHQYDFSGVPEKTEFTELSHLKVDTEVNVDYLDSEDTVKEAGVYYYKWYKDYIDNK